MSALAPGSPLREFEALAREAGAAALAREAAALADRASEGRFYVAVVGQFKRGKSTLINALVGDALLPAGVIPVGRHRARVDHAFRFRSSRYFRVAEPLDDGRVAGQLFLGRVA
ncbi:MAG: hypothetical protein EXR75_11615 [Myxococcales bacterium]|nr:hypothetical protein [Myxococcales bacterium]